MGRGHDLIAWKRAAEQMLLPDVTPRCTEPCEMGVVDRDAHALRGSHIPGLEGSVSPERAV